MCNGGARTGSTTSRNERNGFAETLLKSRTNETRTSSNKSINDCTMNDASHNAAHGKAHLVNWNRVVNARTHKGAAAAISPWAQAASGSDSGRECGPGVMTPNKNDQDQRFTRLMPHNVASLSGNTVILEGHGRTTGNRENDYTIKEYIGRDPSRWRSLCGSAFNGSG